MYSRAPIANTTSYFDRHISSQGEKSQDFGVPLNAGSGRGAVISSTLVSSGGGALGASEDRINGMLGKELGSSDGSSAARLEVAETGTAALDGGTAVELEVGREEARTVAGGF